MTLAEKLVVAGKHYKHHFKHGVARAALEHMGFAITPSLKKIHTSPTTTSECWLQLTGGRYENDERYILKHHFKPASTIIEIGSNIGVVAADAIETRLETNGRIICVEPNPYAIETLQKNIAEAVKRRGKNRAVETSIVNAAICSPTVSEQNETLGFYARPNLSSGLVGQVVERQSDTTTEVPAISLSGILERFNIKSGYSLVMDAEGAEIPMLFEDGDALDRCTQIAIELHSPKLTGSHITPRDMVDRLVQLGFQQRAEVRANYYFTREYA